MGSERWGCPRLASLHRQCLHPTQWARNKIFYEKPVVFINSESPSHPVGSELFQSPTLQWVKQKQSPSHTVGSEHKRTKVQISPYGGLHPTRWARNWKAKRDRRKSPQWRLHPTRWARNRSHRKTYYAWLKECLHPTRWARNLTEVSSFLLPSPVSIPHAGLGTSNHHIKQNKTYQSFCQGGTLSK